MLEVGVDAAVAHHHVVFTTHDAHGVGGGIPRLEVFPWHVNLHTLGLAGFEADALESAQGFNRTAIVFSMSQIHLHHLVAVLFAGVGDIHTDLSVLI